MLIMIDLDNTLADRSAAVTAWAMEFCAKWSLSEGELSWIIAEDNDGYSARVDVLQAIHSRLRLGVSMVGGWMVGDSALHDVSGAQAVGLSTAWLSRGRTWPTELDPPTEILQSLAGLAELVGSPPTD